MSDRITINIDGKDYEVGRNQPLIEAIREAGIETPNFCYHQDLAIAGNCRICLVEAEGPRGPALVISCHMRPAPGMKVRTHLSSEKVVDARKGVMEFLLVNHPLDCPICDKAGECTLQEHYMSSGGHESRLEDDVGKVYKGSPDHRFNDSKGADRGGKHIDIGPTVMLDQERCILCSRCVRFMRDVAGDEQLYIAGRGDHAYITTFPGDDLNHDYDLCTTDVCPVGALTGKHFRFQQRVWFLKTTNSVVPDDSLGANITIDYNRDKVWRLMPRRNPHVNKSWLHNESRLLYQKLDENRLLQGRRDGKASTGNDALVAAGQILKTANKIAIVASGHSSSETQAAVKALAESLGNRAQLFFGSWMAVGEGDGIARSGDPVFNRHGALKQGLVDNLDTLTERAGEFDCLLCVEHDLWGIDAEKAKALSGIKHRIALASWDDETVAQSTIAVGVRSWAEARGSMINCQGRVQQMGACPVLPDQDLESPWEAICRLSSHAADAPIPWASFGDAWKAVADAVEGLAGVPYRKLGPEGLQLEVAEPVEAAE